MRTVLKLSILFFLISCRKEIQIELPKSKPKLVIESYLKPFSFLTNNQMFFKLHKTVGINETLDTSLVIDAKIILYKNNIIVDTLKIDSSNKFYNYNFSLADAPKQGEKFDVKIFHKNFPVTTAKTIIPSHIFLEDTIINPLYSIDENNKARAKIDLIFKDPVGEDFYEIVVSGLSESSYFSISSTFSPIINESYYPSIFNTLNQELPESLLFSDKTFDGKTIKVDVIFSSIIFPPYYVLQTPYKLVLRHITKEYFEYKTSLYEHIKSKQSDILYGVSEPLNVKSFVKNGLGIFTGYNETVVNLTLTYTP